MKGYLRLKMAYLPKQGGQEEEAGEMREEAEVRLWLLELSVIEQLMGLRALFGQAEIHRPEHKPDSSFKPHKEKHYFQ